MRPTPHPAKGVIAMRPDITNRRLAKATERTEPTVSRYLNGIYEPPDSFRAAVAELLGLPEHVLFRPRPCR